jgi:hypothetical protein
MLSNSNYDRGYNKDYPNTECNHDTTPKSYKDYVEQARTCNQCREPTIVEYNLRTQKVSTYELDPYPDQRINHRHPADSITEASVLSAIAAEKRYLFEKRPGDYDSVLGRVLR